MQVALKFWSLFTDIQANARMATAEWSNVYNNTQFWGNSISRIAALDTLFIMGLAKEYKQSKDLVMASFENPEVSLPHTYILVNGELFTSLHDY